MQGDLAHWAPLLNRFDELLERVVQERPELALGDEPPAAPGPFPKELVLALLRTTVALLENCSNKQIYQSHDVRNACWLHRRAAS